MSEEKRNLNSSRIDSDSVFYAKVVPGMLISMAIVMAVLIVFALGVLVGLVPFS